MNGVIEWLAYILLDAAISWYVITKLKIDVNHLLSTVIRWWAMVLIGITVPITPQTLAPWVLFTGSSFWLIFDPLLNKFRGRSFTYRGENNVIDLFGRAHPKLYWGSKIAAIPVAIVTAYLLWLWS